MEGRVFLLGLLVATSCASPLTSTVSFDKAFNAFLQAFKQMAPQGCPSEKIPVLDPLINDFTTFNYTEGQTSLVGNASNTRISGLSNFIVLKGDFDPSTYHVNFDILLPEFQILGSTIMEGFMSILGIRFPFSQNLLVNERLQQLRFVGQYTFAESLTNPNGLRITDFQLQFYLGEVLIDNWDKLWNISQNNFFDRWSQETIAFIAQQVQPLVDTWMNQFVVPHINDFLSTRTMNDLTSLLFNVASDWKNGSCNLD